jgi:hypothetical protein
MYRPRGVRCVDHDDGDDGSEKGRVRVLGNCCYFPADSGGLTCCVMDSWLAGMAGLRRIALVG